MTHYFFKSLFSDNRFKLQTALCLGLFVFIDVNAQDLTVSGAVSTESELLNPKATNVIEKSSHNLIWEASNSELECSYLALTTQDISTNGKFTKDPVYKPHQFNYNS